MGAADAGVSRDGAGSRRSRPLCSYHGFFTKSFAQSFESIPDETIEALEVTGASRLSIFTNAIFPAALSQLVAWAGMRLETNFFECAILGMVGAGGIGYVISNSLQGYDYGTAGVAILLVFLVAYCIERLFVKIKEKILLMERNGMPVPFLFDYLCRTTYNGEGGEKKTHGIRMIKKGTGKPSPTIYKLAKVLDRKRLRCKE